MSDAKVLLDYLQMGLQLWVQDDTLHYRKTKEIPTDDLRTALARDKANLIALIGKNRKCALPSYAQARLWFLDQLAPGSSAYTMPLTYRISGPLHVEALAWSLTELVRRHEALRTIFASADGQPYQVITSVQPWVLPIIDYLALPAAERQAQVQQLMRAESQHLFDLAQGPLFRAYLLRLAADEQVLLLNVHHIIFDGWSVGVLERELTALYRAFRAGHPFSLPELPIQYVDFAIWQRHWLSGQVLDSQLAYWKQQLTGSLPILELPADRPPSAVQTFQGASHSIVLSEILTQSLKDLSNKEGVTLFMLLLAAFETLLYRYTEQEDILLGTPIANRHRLQVEELIGLFINTLVLRVDLSGNPTFHELLGRVREVTLGAYAHQDLPFEKLVEEIQPERDLSRNPLFNILFNFANTPTTVLELAGCTVSLERESAPESKFSLTLYVIEEGAQLRLELVYQPSLFSAERMVCFLSQFCFLLEQIVAHPYESIRRFSLVTPESRGRLPDPRECLLEPSFEPITQIFAAWASRAPEYSALSQIDRTWTYKDLVEGAQALARTLLAHGLERGDRVAIVGPRSFGLVASLLGVLFSGGVILPLDQDLPTKRQWLMVQQAGVKYLLCVGLMQTEDSWLDEFPTLQIVEVVPATGQPIISGRVPESKEALLPTLTPSDPAYIFFTSGTSGIPKGVLGCHKGLSHFLHWQRTTFAIGPQDRSAQLTGLAFDVVLRDIFLPLTSGATLCLPEEPGALDPQILSWLERESISILHTVPTLAQTWLADVPPEVKLPSLRYVFFAGEPLSAALVQQWRGAFPQAGSLVNLYGPTETTLAKCFYSVPSDCLSGIQPVGHPLPETQALVLANDGQLCGIGEPGEIVIRTPFRSLGYINAFEENQKRFIKNPFRDDECDLLYYTGDRGRYRVDGSLDILGRLDHQVKIRGVRIEPDEVTALLSQHPGVQACIVIARYTEQGQAFLVAYVVKSGKNKVSSSELRPYLTQHLPAAMIPSDFVELEAMPLTPNGKVDRRALPIPAMPNRSLATNYLVPRSPTEEVLARIWTDVLGVEQVGVNDNFFDLGGHSSLALRLLAKVRDAFQVNLPLRIIFESPTLADLSEAISQSKFRQAALRHDRPDT